MKVGIAVNCPVCHRTKKPRGRSGAIGLSLCEPELCRAYYNDPKVGDLWPGETEEDFGYPISNHGIKEVPHTFEPEKGQVKL